MQHGLETRKKKKKKRECGRQDESINLYKKEKWTHIIYDTLSLSLYILYIYYIIIVLNIFSRYICFYFNFGVLVCRHALASL